MQSPRIVGIIREAFRALAKQNPAFSEIPADAGERTSLSALGITEENIAALARELRNRVGGIALNIEMMYRMHKAFESTTKGINEYQTLGDMVRHIQGSHSHGIDNPLVVYVDDEEENLFIFRRKYGKRLNLRTFSNSEEARSFIRDTEDIALVITDEMMPNLTGNELCDAVHEFKPFVKFILITGNPAGDENLMLHTLRFGRFFDFINKPLDLENKGEEYFASMEKALSGDF